VGAVVAAVIVVILLIKLFAPTLFFKCKAPPGFVLNAIFGDGLVPPYFSTWAFEEKYFRKVFRDKDVCVCVAAKSGTTWILNIVHQIRTLGDPKGFLKHNSHTTPWPEFKFYPGQTPEQAYEAFTKLDGCVNPEYPFRVMKSHYKPLDEKCSYAEALKKQHIIPVRKHTGVKYIVCMREGKDVLASFYPFFAAHRQEFKDMWGGFPPTFPNWDANFNFFTKEQKGFYHGYAAAWWPYRNDPNVLVLHYNDLKRDLKTQLVRIANFIEVQVPEAAWPKIEEKVGLPWMKAHEHIFKYDVPFTGFGNVMKDDEGSMIRSGGVGDGKDKLSPEQEKIWEQLNEEFFGPQPGLKDWILTGGPIPPVAPSEAGSMKQPLLQK